MLQGRDHVRRRVRLSALQRRADRGRERDRHPAHAARRLLPRGRLRRASPTTRSGASATATPLAGPSACRRSRARRSAPRSTRCARSRRTRSRPSSSGRSGKPLHFHVSEQRAENEACLAAHGCTPVELLAEHGALGPDSHRRPRDAPDRATTSALLHETTICMCPTTERDLADGIGRAGPNRRLGSDSHAVIDLFEEARAVELDLRLATERRGHFTAARPAARRHRTTRASGGPTPAGSSPARSPTSSRSASTRRAWRRRSPRRCSNRSCSRPPPPTSAA